MTYSESLESLIICFRLYGPKSDQQIILHPPFTLYSVWCVSKSTKVQNLYGKRSCQIHEVQNWQWWDY